MSKKLNFLESSFCKVLRPPQLNLRIIKPSSMAVFAFVLFALFIVFAGVIYDLIVEPPSIGVEYVSIFQYNGSTIVAMAGKNCVAIAGDTRFGVRNQTVALDSNRIFKINNRTLFGMTGLNTDILTLRESFKFQMNLYNLEEEREISPKTFAHNVAQTLYSKRFGPYFITPIIAGLEGEDYTPFLCATDLIGAMEFPKSFVVAGTGEESLMGVCETFYKENMEPDELFEVISQCLLAAVDRDALSGWGSVVHVLTKDGITTKRLRTRKD
ncbi:proteasome subunit beta type-3 [Anaeramoeba flamelloides]|uniref:Proteasome subunit beta n=2 Tax=Anaeramoeba flamelloides TaxID=1746091 RepID=A0ABQ8X4G8_9EUKA|nr:proteasome subunit beta type-3 [Anaeramoeba flamelloides]